MDFDFTPRHIRFFTHARHMAEMSDYTRCPIGCIAVYKNKIIGCGFNSHRTHPLQQQYNQYRNFGNNAGNALAKIHSEIAVISQIQNLGIDYSKVELYIYRKCKSRDCGIARPCEGCLRAILELGIRRIFFTTDTGLSFEKLA
jgi:deoxycytidylate deaminase